MTTPSEIARITAEEVIDVIERNLGPMMGGEREHLLGEIQEIVMQNIR